MSELQRLRAQRMDLAKLIQQQRDKLTAESYELTSEDRGNWEQLNKDFDTVDLKINALERGKAVDDLMNGRRDWTPGTEDRGGWQKGEGRKLSPEETAERSNLIAQS